MASPLLRALGIASLLLLHSASDADETTKDEPLALFNGKDLTGWGYKSGEKFDGKTESDDKRYTAKDGMIVVNPGKGIKQLWTTRAFPDDFELRLEFRAAVNADSGSVPPRAAAAGARLPRRRPVQGPQEVQAPGLERDRRRRQGQDVAHCTCNGEVLEAALKVPATGGIGLEADRGQMEYRNIRLKAIR